MGADEIIQNLHPAGRSGKDGNHLNDAERQLIREAKKEELKLNLLELKNQCVADARKEREEQGY